MQLICVHMFVLSRIACCHKCVFCRGIVIEIRKPEMSRSVTVFYDLLLGINYKSMRKRNPPTHALHVYVAYFIEVHFVYCSFFMIALAEVGHLWPSQVDFIC